MLKRKTETRYEYVDIKYEPIDIAIENLIATRKSLTDRGFTDLVLEIDGTDYEVEVTISGKKLESEEEFEVRLQEEVARRKQVAEQFKAQLEISKQLEAATEYATYLKLKAKYEIP